MEEGFFEYKCAICGINSWMGKPIVLRLDHVYGVLTDYRIQNLRLLCHNCDSQTEFYCAKNIKRKVKQRPICQCGKEMYWGSPRCIDCSRHSGNRRNTCWKTKISWPSIEELVNMVKETSYTHVGRSLGVSDVAVHVKLESQGIRNLKGHIRGVRGSKKPALPKLTIWEYMVRKYGLEKARSMNSKAAQRKTMETLKGLEPSLF